MTTGTISIAMATYNGAKYITEQLESFSSQTLWPAELVVTDDCSTDGTVEIITNFKARAPFPVRIERNDAQLGYKSNFLKVTSLCRSEFIAFSDQDDVWLPGKLRACHSAFDQDDILLACHNATVVTETLEPIGPLIRYDDSPDINKWRSEPSQYGLGFTLMFRRSLLSFSDHWPLSVDFNALNETKAHDQWFCFLASCLGTVAYIKEPQVLYRQHRTSTCGWHETKEPGWWKNLSNSNVDSLKMLEIIAGSRAAILEKIQQELPDIQRSRASSASIGYRNIETYYRLRREMYETDEVISRMRHLFGLLLKGGYRPKTQWGVGKKALVRDAICNVFLKNRNSAS